MDRGSTKLPRLPLYINTSCRVKQYLDDDNEQSQKAKFNNNQLDDEYSTSKDVPQQVARQILNMTWNDKRIVCKQNAMVSEKDVVLIRVCLTCCSSLDDGVRFFGTFVRSSFG